MAVQMMLITATVVITTATAGAVAPIAEAAARQMTAGTVTPQQPAEAVTGRRLAQPAGLLPPRPRVGSRLHAGPTDGTCDAGSFCAWNGANFTGKAARLNLQTANPNQCVPLPDDLVAKSWVNAMTKDVSVYESAHCSTESEFTTYPKGGSYMPNAPFVVRAIQVWE